MQNLAMYLLIGVLCFFAGYQFCNTKTKIRNRQVMNALLQAVEQAQKEKEEEENGRTE